MPGGNKQQTVQSQQSQTDPWAPAIPMLKSMLGSLGGASPTATDQQVAALGNLSNAAANLPSFVPQATGAVNNMFGTSTTPQQGMLTTAFDKAAAALNPMLGTDYTNPYTNPAFSAALGTLNTDITNQINGQFAAAGRPLGTNASSAQALARGLAQGEGGMLANQFNTLTGNQIAAANALPGLAGSTASALTGQQQVPLQNALMGMGAAGQLPGLALTPAGAQLQAATMAANPGIMNMGDIEKLALPIAGMGAQSTGSGQSTTQTTTPWWTTALGAGLMGASLLPSDERIKDDIKPVGMLYDGQKIYSYRYKGSSTPQIGLLAQEVEQHRPDAVGEIGGGIKGVDYGKATERSRAIAGMLSDMSMSA